MVTDANGCTEECSVEVNIIVPDPVSFTAPADLCIDAGVQAGLSGGSPTGGTYSGSGVTDDGNGMTYTFDSRTQRWISYWWHVQWFRRYR